MELERIIKKEISVQIFVGSKEVPTFAAVMYKFFLRA